jgi:hypothetical protein
MKVTKNGTEYSLSLGRDFNLVFPKHEVGVYPFDCDVWVGVVLAARHVEYSVFLSALTLSFRKPLNY